MKFGPVAGLFSVASLALLAPALPTAAAPQATQQHVHRVFDVMRNGSKIGTDTYDITRSGDTTDVRQTTHILVKIAFITAYKYDHADSEKWKGNQLVSYASTTNDNGTDHSVSAAAAGPKMMVTVDGASAPAARIIAPATLWSAAAAKRPQLFDPGTGKRMTVKADDLGTETVSINGVPRQLDHVKLTGQLDRDLWFDEDGLVKMTLQGSDHSTVTSQLRQSTASR